MAKITLSPNEAFEHIHSAISYTTLLRGRGILKMQGKEIKMVVGKQIKIPAGETHTITNVGDFDLDVTCLHPAIRARKKRT